MGGVIAKTGSLAVPVVVNHQVLCCLSLIFILAGMKVDQAVEQFETPLKRAAGRIAGAAIHLMDVGKMDDVSGS